MGLKREIKIEYYKLIMKLHALTHPIEKKVVFSSFWGKQYSDNPRAVSEALHRLHPEIKQVWFLSSASEAYNVVPEYITVVRTMESYYRELSTAFCFVTNENLPESIVKRRNQFFVQTWHGGRGYKKILYEAWEGGNRPSPVMDEFYTDLCVAGSDFGVSYFRDGFHYKGEILKQGCPRNDILLNITPELQGSIRDRIGVEADTKVMVYAPTFRDSSQMNGKPVDIAAVLNKLNKKDKWMCLTRLHPMDKSAELLKNSQGCIDVTMYPDMADLLAIADLLVTDYSSSAPDFALTGKPIILATFDRVEYTASSRELKIPIEAPGYLIADNQELLMGIVSHLDEYDHEEIDRKVLDYYGTFETGKSSEAVSEKIYDYYVQHFGG